jgi:uncharacterized membrane protein YjjP (DUF1212 family)
MSAPMTQEEFFQMQREQLRLQREQGRLLLEIGERVERIEQIMRLPGRLEAVQAENDAVYEAALRAVRKVQAN